MPAAREFLERTSFHGLKYLTKEGLHWAERLYWLVCYVAAWLCTAALVLASWDSYARNSVRFVVDTAYLGWNTSFPAVTVCERNNRARAALFAELFYGKSGDPNTAALFNEIAYLQPPMYYILNACGVGGKKARLNCPTDLMQVALQIRSNCSEMMMMCTWEGQEFPCCNHFLPLETEFGVCYSIRSAHTGGTMMFDSDLDMTRNWQDGPSQLQIKLRGPAMVYVHDHEDVPTITTSRSQYTEIRLNAITRILFTVRSVTNDPDIANVPVELRLCRFPEENILTVYDMYSHSGCIVECRKALQKKLCNCTSYLMPRIEKSEACDLEGTVCLLSKAIHFETLSPKPKRKGGMYCPCLLSCQQSDIGIIYESQDRITPDVENIAEVSIALAQLPSEQDHRRMIKTNVDLVVSVGSASALLLGASLISFVELFYHFTIRLYTNWSKSKKSTIHVQADMRRKKFINPEMASTMRKGVNGGRQKLLTVIPGIHNMTTILGNSQLPQIY